jgi:hypothetical protein
MFGKPKEGVHQYRLFDIAIVDVIMTILAIWFVVMVTKYSWIVVKFCMIVFMVLCHRLFCVRTTIDKLLFP